MKNEKYYQQFLNNNSYPRSLKSLEVIQGFSSIYLSDNGKKIINFSSSDYLGLANHPHLIARSHEYAKHYGMGSSASRLVSGNFDCYMQLEAELAKALNKPAALIFGTGYQTNQAVLEALLNPQVLGQEPLIFCDKLCHASMLAGMASFLHLQRFAHNDLTHLRILLNKHKQSERPKFILAESLYSMEGDQADLENLSKIAEEYEAFLYVDDAHAVGVYGTHGWGTAGEYAEKISIIMGTFSKALGSFGGFIGCSETIKNYLINKCRGFIYSTGLSPAVLGAIKAAIELLPQLDTARIRLWDRAAQVRAFFRQEGLNCGESTTHIIPWIIGDAQKTLYASQLLEQKGILGMGIRPPSVPAGKSRIRFCLTAAHSDEDIQQLIQAVKQVKAKLVNE